MARKLAFVPASSKYGTTIVNRFDSRIERIKAIGARLTKWLEHHDYKVMHVGINMLAFDSTDQALAKTS